MFPIKRLQVRYLSVVLKLVIKSVRISGPNDFHPITVAMIKIDTSDVTNLLRENAHKIVNLVKDPERREKLFESVLSTL